MLEKSFLGALGNSAVYGAGGYCVLWVYMASIFSYMLMSCLLKFLWGFKPKHIENYQQTHVWLCL